MRVPQFWAGMGRAVNNLCAILIGSFSVALIRSRRQYEDHDCIDRVICADQHCDLYLHGDGTDGCGIA